MVHWGGGCCLARWPPYKSQITSCGADLKSTQPQRPTSSLPGDAAWHGGGGGLSDCLEKHRENEKGEREGKKYVLFRNILGFELGSPWCRNVFGAADYLDPQVLN